FAAGADTLAARAADLGMVALAGATRGGRPALLGLGEAAAARARAGAFAVAAGQPYGQPSDPAALAQLDTLAAIAALRKRPGIRHAEPNYIVHSSATPNDQYYNLQWHYPLINLPQAWDITTGSGSGAASVVVAVVDCGVVLGHPDLSGKLVG